MKLYTGVLLTAFFLCSTVYSLYMPSPLSAAKTTTGEPGIQSELSSGPKLNVDPLENALPNSAEKANGGANENIHEEDIKGSKDNDNKSHNDNEGLEDLLLKEANGWSGVRPCQLPARGIVQEKQIAYRSVFFAHSAGGKNNTFNAGVAAKYLNGLELAPGQVFSFNQTVGIRTTERGFIVGKDILNNNTIGGGICRTATVLYQAATAANLPILERHPHTKPVHYTLMGTDATISWGAKDLKFKNNRPNSIVVYAGLREGEKGQHLWAELRDRQTPLLVEIVISPDSDPESSSAKKANEVGLVALVEAGTAFASIEQLSDLYQASASIKEVEGLLTASVQLTDKSIDFHVGSKQALVNGQEYELVQAPYRLDNSNCVFWIPLSDWAKLTDSKAQWTDGGQPLIILKMPASDE